MGDPAGIGPEIFLKAISKINSKEIFERIIVVSSLSVLDFVNSQLKFGFRFNELFNIKDTKPNKINFINVQNCPNYKVGKSDENNADYVIDCINIASDLAFENRFNLVTGPINKSVISSKIKNFQGHTEYLKNKFSCNDDIYSSSFSNMIKVLFSSYLADAYRIIYQIQSAILQANHGHILQHL